MILLERKKEDAEILRREMEYIAHAIQRIEPSKVSRLLYLQVWNDDGQSMTDMPASPEDFMGEVKIELELPENGEVRGKEMRLRLQPNLSIVKREITGFITVRYDWGFPVHEAEDDGVSPPLKKLLHGTLRLEIISATGLVNNDWARKAPDDLCRFPPLSSPYVLALCYPNSPRPEAHLNPVVWRCPTAHQMLNPQWQCGHTFHYLWYVPIDTVEYRSRAAAHCNRMIRSKSYIGGCGSGKNAVTRFCKSDSSNSSSKLEPFFPDSPSPDEVMSMLLTLTTSMPKLTSSLGQIQEQVVNLGARVDQLSASLRDRPTGGEGPGRPSYDLRGVARGDSPPKGSWDRSERSNGVSSPVLEDSLEEVMNVGVVVNGGPLGLVADAASLPHAIPHGPGG